MPAIKMTATQQRICRVRAGITRNMALKNLNNTDVAKRMGVTSRTVDNWIDSPETLNLDKLWRLSLVLGCPIEELCGGELPEEAVARIMRTALERR